ncbi:GDSL-type esterase/lipase family protein [Sphingomonas sp. S1-29]|uniref:SGNH/GDSL hydrolase family protein n=1 Tax=Sphingomonas sp. S1-29 TaxID=2991074 RepID=UPI002240E1FA|nr:GDSL-type esterase/lipase family protein [Sphingomonas sp. S1-29]UZK69591.1 GDSL-type esterase/lipase family protein [Sphingomonas sp. S1-29]
MLTINTPDFGKIFATADTFDDLRSIPARQLRDGYWALVGGAEAPADGLGGLYSWNDYATDDDDGETVISPVETTSAGRWVKIAVGRVGPAGPAGPQGPQGPQGATGATGPAGDAKLIPDIAALKARTYTVGDTVSTAIYGGSVWSIVKKVELQPDFFGSLTPPGSDSSVVNYDDELHLVVNLTDGSTGMAELELGSVAGYVQQLQTKQYAQVFARLRQASSLPTAATVVCYGDSITYGQTGDPNYPGANPLTGQPTGYGDGSVHNFHQIPGPWPETMKSFADQVFGVNKVAVLNRGYSGDKVGTSYRRSRFPLGQTITYIALGTNDQLFATANGTDQTGLFRTDDGYQGSYAFRRFVDAYRKYIYREILRGSVPIILTPAPHTSLVGYDGTDRASAKMLAYYNNALHALGEEVGTLVIDGADILGQYPVSEVTLDGIHPNPIGANIMAARLLAPLIGRGWKYPEVVSGERSITASILTESIGGTGGTATNEINNTLNTSSRGRPFSNSEALDVVILPESGRIFYSFRLDEDEKAVIPIGSANPNTVMIYNADFGTATPALRLTLDETKAITVRDDFVGDQTIQTTGPMQFTSEASNASPLIVTGKGWHTVSLGATSGAFVLNGLRFFKDAGWRSLTLKTGFTQFGSIAPAYRVKDGVLEFRGIVLNEAASTTSDIFDIPASIVPRLPSVMGVQPTRFATTPVAISLSNEKAVWVANDGAAGNANLFSLGNIRIPTLTTP